MREKKIINNGLQLEKKSEQYFKDVQKEIEKSICENKDDTSKTDKE